MRNGATFRIAALAAVLATICGCEPGGDLKLLTSTEVGHDYRLGPTDEVRVTTYNEPTLSGEFVVDQGGAVALPLLGPVQADGLTTAELSHRIEDTLHARKLFAEPNVVTQVIRYRPVYVLGEVQHPGPFAFQAHMTFLEVVALAGGFTPRAVKSRAEIIRVTARGTEQGRLEPASTVQPGDVITVLERNF